MSTSLATRAAKFLEQRSGRRGFLRRGALVGSAMAVAPAGYVLKPTTAYAAICNCSGQSCDCGATCCDGYTEFCCTLNGNNGCPPNTTYGGWWKADGSGYCDNNGPQPRYYLDCNAPCNNCGCGSSGVCSGGCSGTPCGCGNGSCGNRKVGCTGFRYGQCNQNVACLGPIVCRVVTCTPPWALDPTCTTAVRTDNNTRFHNRPCLQTDPGNPEGNVAAVQLAPDGARVVGYVVAGAPTTIQISHGGNVLATGTANKTAAQVGQTPPSGQAVNWFAINVDLAPGGRTLCASVVDGNGARVIGCRFFRVPGGNPIGSLDNAIATGDGTVEVTGWAIDPDSSAPLGVHVYVDGRYAGAGTANQDRFDVGVAYPAFGARHGYKVRVPAGTGPHEVCVFAINREAGTNAQIGCDQVVVPGGSPFGRFKPRAVAGGVFVRGWVIDPDTVGPVTVDISVDGQVVATQVANIPRADLAGVYPGSGQNHGFELVLLTGPGTQEICVDARNAAGSGSTKRIGCKSVSVAGGNPQGELEVVEGGPGEILISGWAVDPDTTAKANLHVYVDGQYNRALTANQSRPDVIGQGSTGGFSARIPVGLGAHSVCVYVLNKSGAGSPVNLGCRTVRTLRDSPIGTVERVVGGNGNLTVRGWALDPDATGPIWCHVYVDGSYAGAVLADRNRTSVGNRYPTHGPLHGYRLTVPASPGNHTVCVYALDRRGGHSNSALGCKSATVQ